MKVYEAFPRITHIEPTKEIGIEVEMEGQNLPTQVRITGWRQEADNSLRGESVEFVLTHPIKRKDKTKYLTILDAALRNAGTRQADTDRCGVHIHLNVQELETDQLMNFVLLYLMFEDVLVHYCGEEREGNLFCLRASDADMLLHTLRKCRAHDRWDLISNDNYRYSSLNLASLAKYGSAEFRSLKTPRDVKDIEEWIDILLCVYDFALEVKEPADIVEALSKNGEIEYLKLVFGKLHRKLLYDGCHVAIREGARRIQDIAYQKRTKKSKQDLMNEAPEWLIGNGDVPPAPIARRGGWNPRLNQAPADWAIQLAPAEGPAEPGPAPQPQINRVPPRPNVAIPPGMELRLVNNAWQFVVLPRNDRPPESIGRFGYVNGLCYVVNGAGIPARLATADDMAFIVRANLIRDRAWESLMERARIGANLPPDYFPARGENRCPYIVAADVPAWAAAPEPAEEDPEPPEEWEPEEDDF